MNKPKNVTDTDWQLLKEKYPNKLNDISVLLENDYPVQYLIGNVEFIDSIIKVDKRVLIPRFETELFVEKTINYAKKIFKNKINIVDLGTGSGCISIALKKHLDCNIDAIDISKDAIKLAKENAKLNKVKIDFINKNMIDELDKNYDIIISNPPYIAKDGYIEKKVLENEPHIALFAENNGLYYYEKIINNHLKKLNKLGLMAFEIGDNQNKELEKIMFKNKIKKYKFEVDLTGRIRYLFIFNE